MERKLGTKAETLERLYGQLEKARVLPQVSFTVEQWYQDKNAVINKVEEVSWNENVIVRSSSLNEDTQSGSQAGKYESIGNV